MGLDKNGTRRDDIPTKWGRKDQALEDRKTVLHEEFWYKFALLARVCYMHDPESTIYDVFDTMRTKIMGGWEFDEDLLKKIDAQIEEEENAKLENLSN